MLKLYTKNHLPGVPFLGSLSMMGRSFPTSLSGVVPTSPSASTLDKGFSAVKVKFASKTSPSRRKRYVPRRRTSKAAELDVL